MESRTPPTGETGGAAGSGGPAGSGTDSRLSVVLTSVVAGARRRAVRDGDRQIDTAHLLHSLLELDPGTRAVFDGGPPQIARLLGYLAQRSIGYGIRWRGTVEDSGAIPAQRDGSSAAPGWSPAACGAMEAALARADARAPADASASGAQGGGGPEGPDVLTQGLDLLAALVADPGCRAVEVLRRAGVGVESLLERLHEEERGDRNGGERHSSCRTP